jgi:hypothetical protein
VVIAID